MHEKQGQQTAFFSETEQNQFIYWLDFAILPTDEGKK